ncbi:MAG: hypothetical protein ACO1SX_00540 [Actinomycetota bacterium]
MSSAPRARLTLEQLLGRLDRRIIYLGLFLVTLAPLVGKWALPLHLSEPPQRLYRAIESLPPDKLVLITSNWDAGSQAETRPQLVGITRHLIRRNLKVALISTAYPTSPQLATTAVEEAIRLENAGDRVRYGQEWVNLGFKLPDEPWLRSFASSIPGAVTEDVRGTPLAGIPLMQGVQRFGPEGQVSMLIDITGSNTIDRWYEFLSPTKVRIGLGCTAVMAPEQYPYLDSGQLSGLLTGMKGAAEYEQLLHAPGFAMPAMAGQSFAHLYIVFLIVLANVAVLAGRRRRRG